MAKMVILVDGAEHDAEAVVRDLSSIPGVSVTSRSDAFIDVKTDSKGSLARLKKFAQGSSGLSLHPVAEPELMEPIPTSKIF
jgi:hypothetical protein